MSFKRSRAVSPPSVTLVTTSSLRHAGPTLAHALGVWAVIGSRMRLIAWFHWEWSCWTGLRVVSYPRASCLCFPWFCPSFLLGLPVWFCRAKRLRLVRGGGTAIGRLYRRRRLLRNNLARVGFSIRAKWCR